MWGGGAGVGGAMGATEAGVSTVTFVVATVAGCLGGGVVAAGAVSLVWLSPVGGGVVGLVVTI